MERERKFNVAELCSYNRLWAEIFQKSAENRVFPKNGHFLAYGPYGKLLKKAQWQELHVV